MTDEYALNLPERWLVQTAAVAAVIVACRETDDVAEARREAVQKVEEELIVVRQAKASIENIRGFVERLINKIPEP